MSDAEHVCHLAQFCVRRPVYTQLWMVGDQISDLARTVLEELQRRYDRPIECDPTRQQHDFSRGGHSIPACTIHSLVKNHDSQRKLIIAIDGPAGVGKSTIASRLARKLGYANLESGAMYRALALQAIEWDISFDDEAALTELAHDSRIQLEPTSSGTRVLLDGRDVTLRVRETDVTAGASRVSVHPKVREWMVARQQELGAGGGVVMEGRDIGTKVFPNADVKIFLDADPIVREQRRLQQQNLRGGAAETTAAELRERDYRDRTRAASPLAPAADAMVIDSSSMSEDEVLRRIEGLVQQKT